MRKICSRLYVGDENDCSRSITGKRVIVHACKHPCFETAATDRLMDCEHNYSVEKECELYVNIIDPPKPLFRIQVFEAAMVFMRRNWQKFGVYTDNDFRLLIHCNKGHSRAPSLALLFMANHLELINSETFESARKDYQLYDPDYDPGDGIVDFMTEHWNLLKRL